VLFGLLVTVGLPNPRGGAGGEPPGPRAGERAEPAVEAGAAT